MDIVNTTPETTSNPTQGSTSQPTQEVSSNPTPPDVGQQEESDASLEPASKKLRSSVWAEFTNVKVKGLDKAECNWCKKRLSATSTNGTTHLHGHLKGCVQKIIKTRKHDKGQPFIMPTISEGREELGIGNYNPENVKKLIAEAIIMHDYPLSIVDHVGLKRVFVALQQLFKVPTRNTIKKEVLKVYDFEKKCAMKMLDSHQGRVAITIDMWTASNQKKGYMVVTAHYIDGSWTLQSRILRFIYVPAPHTSERLGDALVETLLQWNIDSKLCTITVDNCSTNDSMIKKIKNKLPLESLISDGSLLHMRCCAHILNLTVQDGLQVIKDGAEKIRDSVGFWSATGKRYEKIENTARQLKIACTRKLALDCPTRWNSTYKMLDIAIEYKDVFIRLNFKRCDPLYTCLPTNSQWQFAKDVCGCLKLFNEVTELISGTKYPTANLYFPKICKIKLAIEECKKSSNSVNEMMATKMMEKFQIYWSGVHDMMGVAAVLDPTKKMVVLDFWFPKLYGQESGEQASRIKELCYSLLYDYQQMRHRDAQPTTPSIGTTAVNGAMYPTLQAIARDVLAIPISTVASESAFSTSGRILSPHCSRLNWTIVEALMCARSLLWTAENDGTSKVAQEYATMLNEMEYDDEAELMESSFGYHFED
ncbi:unnamed protein product [Trifolium pratense]|uniref:Uncharacterized protein n=1 Tax=Trifolium pratense TaxID=57577 RepID=A0ACB0IYT3_TRIPR|nr:unnamed protein product [Trifolium pratense]